MEKFIIDGLYGKLLAANGIKPQMVLTKANLPLDTFAHESLKLSEEQYFAMISAIDQITTDPLLPTKLVATDNIETFSPAIFAAYCSKNGLRFLQRLAHYKKLIGPVTYKITADQDAVTITLSMINSGNPLPSFFVKGEFAFMVQLLSKATNHNIRPTKITTVFTERDRAIQDYFARSFTPEAINSISFSKTDLQIPFVSENTSLLDYLEPELKKRLADLDVDDSSSKRVRTVLVELLPRGEFTIDDTAQSLGVSRRTLQRKLKGENTNFPQQLNATREMLAKNYLLYTSMTTDEFVTCLSRNKFIFTCL
ncbi:MAG TPA: AraC family transcriptional regulator ligand-binding domain-containing protein [Limosilactobacillus coleohominis]|nr:AraC family transcriptional regulator ligand-binding domain-containing protein [Limosilactobacillus coleohominis]